MSVSRPDAKPDPPAIGADPRHPTSPRPIALAAPILAIVYAAVVGLVAVWRDPPTPPALIGTPLVTSGLLAVSGGVGLVASMRGSSVLMATSGALTLVQAPLAFSGVTLPFAPIGLTMLALARGAGPVRARDLAVALGVVAAWLGAWGARLALTEERCVTDATSTICSSAEITPLGMTVAITLAVLAVALSALVPPRALRGR